MGTNDDDDGGGQPSAVADDAAAGELHAVGDASAVAVVVGADGAVAVEFVAQSVAVANAVVGFVDVRVQGGWVEPWVVLVEPLMLPLLLNLWSHIGGR